MDAKRAIEMVAEQKGVSAEQVIREIESAIAGAMQNSDPLIRARWALIPCSGDRPTAYELVSYIGGKIHCDDHNE